MCNLFTKEEVLHRYYIETESTKKEVTGEMRYLEDHDCNEYCGYYPVCVKFGKLYLEGCVLDGEGFQRRYPKDAQEREQRIARLLEKLKAEDSEMRTVMR